MAAEEDIKKMLEEVQASLDRSRRSLEALEERQRRHSPPPPPPPSVAPYTRRSTASYDADFLANRPTPPPAAPAPPPAANSAEPVPEGWSSGERPTSRLSHVPPVTERSPSDDGRYTIVQPRSPRRAR